MGTDRLTTNSIKEMLDAVQADRESKQVFLNMPRNEQLLAILGLIAYVTNQIAMLQKENLEYRTEREKREKQLRKLLDENPDVEQMSPDEKQSLTQKIIALATRPAKVGQLTDKIMSLALLILFWMAMTGRLP